MLFVPSLLSEQPTAYNTRSHCSQDELCLVFPLNLSFCDVNDLHSVTLIINTTRMIAALD